MNRTTQEGHTSSAEGDVSRKAAPTATESEQVVEEGEATELGLDEVFDALRNARRRQVLQYLSERNTEVALSDLAEHVAAIENDTTPEALGTQQRKRVYVGLYQSHLPKLDSIGVLTFDQDRGLIERTAAADQLDKYLSTDDANDDTNARPWQQHYIGFTAVSAVVLLLGSVLGIVGSIDAVSLFLGICVGTASLAAFHAYERR